MRTITSKRLLLRPWRDDDADFLLDLESRWEVVRFLGAHPAIMRTRQDALASIRRRRAVGWHLHPDAWGQGYATEAAEAVLHDAFGRGLARVVAVTDPDNHASQAVCRRLGMTASGRTAKYYDAVHELFEMDDGRGRMRSRQGAEGLDAAGVARDDEHVPGVDGGGRGRVGEPLARSFDRHHGDAVGAA